MSNSRLLALRGFIAGAAFLLSPLAGATAAVSFASAGCLGEGDSACFNVLFDQSFIGTGGFGTGGYGGFLSGTGVNADIAGEARASAGRSLGALAAMRGTTAYYSPIARVTTVSRFTDSVTILHPRGQFGSGILSLWMRIDGIAEVRNPDPNVVAVALIDAGRYEPSLDPLYGSSVNRPGEYGWQVTGAFVIAVQLVPVLFEFGTPFDLGVELLATTLAFYQGQERGSGDFDIRLDALNTAVFGQIEVTDSSGPVTGYTVNSDSGFDYRIAAAVPEPQTWWLAALGLIAVAWRSTRRGCTPVRP